MDKSSRIRRLWDAVKDAFFAEDFDRALRVLRIIGDHSLDEDDQFLATDYGKYICEVRSAKGQDPAERMSSASLDKFQGEDQEPETILIEAEENECEARRCRWKIKKYLGEGRVEDARRDLHWMAVHSVAWARDWAEQKLIELGEKP